MFKKSIIAVAVLVATISTAAAQHRGGHYAPRYSHGHGINPWVAGAVGLGILGAGIYAGSRYYDYDRVCWRSVVGYDVWGRPIIRRICE